MTLRWCGKAGNRGRWVTDQMIKVLCLGLLISLALCGSFCFLVIELSYKSSLSFVLVKHRRKLDWQQTQTEKQTNKHKTPTPRNLRTIPSSKNRKTKINQNKKIFHPSLILAFSPPPSFITPSSPPPFQTLVLLGSLVPLRRWMEGGRKEEGEKGGRGERT